jgi:hypothetical protein
MNATELLSGFNGADMNDDGLLTFAEAGTVVSGLTMPAFETLDANADGFLSPGELLAVAGPGIVHNVDLDGNGVLSLSELLRVIQFYNAGGYACAANAGATEDGFTPGSGDAGCPPHASDYDPADRLLSLSELLRAVQFFNVGGILWCPMDGTEDGFCAAAP